jgi:hypothetical protein
MNFFRPSGSKTKAPPDLVRSLREAIYRLDSPQVSPEQKRKVRSRCCSVSRVSLCTGTTPAAR